MFFLVLSSLALILAELIQKIVDVFAHFLVGNWLLGGVNLLDLLQVVTVAVAFVVGRFQPDLTANLRILL